jgi:hypothetical protein
MDRNVKGGGKNEKSFINNYFVVGVFPDNRYRFGTGLFSSWGLSPSGYWSSSNCRAPSGLLPVS